MGKKKKQITGAERAIGARIRMRREALGLSVTDVGLAFGGTRQQAQFWERGENFPPVADFARLCSLLRTDANHLLGVEQVGELTEKEIRAARLEVQTAAMAVRNERRLQLGRRLYRRSKDAG